MGKQWLVNIDVPIWASALCDGIEWDALLSIIDAINPVDTQLLYREELLQMEDDVDFDMQWMLFSKLTKVSTVGYDSDDKAKYVNTSPSVTAEIDNEKQKQEIEYQIGYLYNRSDSKPRPLLASNRISGTEVVLTCDKKNPRTLFICGTTPDSIRQRIDLLMPRLNQNKHFQFERNIGKGRVASTFSAYDRRNEEPAKRLLKEAFEYYSGEDLPASSLWAWDDKHHCYVRFMHSGNLEYHGYDERNMDRVPKDVRKAFGE